MADFSNKLVVITGGNSGIGLATARRFLQLGARLLIAGRDSKSLAAARRELGSRAETCEGDLRTSAARERLTAQVRDMGGGIDVLFVNAGVAQTATVGTMTANHVDEIIDVNVKSVALTVCACVPLMSPGGSIVLNGSWLARGGHPGLALLAASKAAVVSLGETFALELAPAGIRVNTISPGPIDTPIYGRLGLSAEQVQSMASSIVAKTPLSRFGRAEEIAGMVIAITSADAAYVTGANVLVDGGLSLRH